MANHVQIVFDDEQRIARGLQAIERGEQRLGVGGMQAGRRFVEHVHDAEQIGADLRGQPQTLQLAGRKRGRAAFHRKIAEAEVEHHARCVRPDPGDALRDHRLFRMLGRQLRQRVGCAFRSGPQKAGQTRLSDSADISAMSEPSNFTDSDSRRRRLPWHSGHSVLIKYCDTRFLVNALCGVRESVQDVSLDAGERAHVAGLLLALESAARFCGSEAGVDRDGGLLVGEENPVAIFLGKVAPGTIDVVAERDQDVALVLSAPGGGPRGDGAFTDGQRIVRHHGAFGDVVDAAETMALRAGAFRRVGRERFGLQMRLARRVGSGARIQHPQQIG